jgi:hypothetical protein
MPPVFHDDPHHPSLRTFVRDPSLITGPPLWALPVGGELLRRAVEARRDAGSAEDALAAWVVHRRVLALLRDVRRGRCGRCGGRLPTAGRAGGPGA